MMPVWDAAGFLRTVAPEDASFHWLLEAVADIRQVTMGRVHARVLLELAAMNRTPPLTDQIMLGERLARLLPHVQRAAAVVDQHVGMNYCERAARSLGMDLRVFTSSAQAIAWLQEPLADPKRASGPAFVRDDTASRHASVAGDNAQTAPRSITRAV